MINIYLNCFKLLTWLTNRERTLGKLGTDKFYAPKSYLGHPIKKTAQIDSFFKKKESKKQNTLSPPPNGVGVGIGVSSTAIYIYYNMNLLRVWKISYPQTNLGCLITRRTKIKSHLKKHTNYSTATSGHTRLPYLAAQCRI